jgi:hypothetical protein
MQAQKYDELYTRLLAVNAQNAKLTKEMHPVVNPKVQVAMDETVKAQLLSHSFSKEM